MAVRLVLAGLGLALVGALEFPEDRFRAMDGLRAPYDVDRQRALEALPSFNRAPLQQLNPSAQVSNSPAFEHPPSQNKAPGAPVQGTATGTAQNLTAVEDTHRLQNLPAAPNKAFFEHGPGNAAYGMEHAGGDEVSKQLVEQDLGKLQRRKFRLRHRKGLKERKARKFQKLMEDDLPREVPSGLAGPGGAGGQSGFGGAADPHEAANSVLPRSPGEPVSRFEALAGLKVEYARAFIAAEEPETDSGPMELLCTVGFKEYASITWTVNGRPLENFIDRSTLTTLKNEVPVKVSKITVSQLERLPSENGKFVFECTALVDAQVTKATIALGSIIEDTCTSNAQCEARGASCSEGRCLCKASQPVSLKSKHLTCRAAANLGWPCDYSEQCSFVQPNSLCSDSLVCACSLGFVKSLDGKTCDKLTAGNLIGSACKVSADCHGVGASCANNVCACTNDTVERGGMCIPLAHLKLGLEAVRGTNFLGAEDSIKTVQNDTRFTVAAAMINDGGDRKETAPNTALTAPPKSGAGDSEPTSYLALLSGALAMIILARGP
ncbi:unnamed protein product [Ixodes hexagonus]